MWNYYREMGVPVNEIPTSSFRFMHRMDGLLQRLGAESVQRRVFSDVLLRDFFELLETDRARARGWPVSRTG